MVSKARRGQRSSASFTKQTQNIGDAPGKEKEAEKPVKVDKWDGSAVRNALDDAVKKVFAEKYHYVENHRLVDCRLALCLIAVGAAGFALLWDFLYPFPESRPGAHRLRTVLLLAHGPAQALLGLCGKEHLPRGAAKKTKPDWTPTTSGR
ncbi:hypothetical protein HPB48_020721 [Haemaphysalis longicornis]|uniref:Signal peptidase complex subunit 2 n=1 Tax=Haemaphysalis longicornis TaxID=44386 RepID=A0A9J6GAR9_HAELO|nr:hypothetical protein HPB48_020721 [Haemaphysalis longicornis]